MTNLDTIFRFMAFIIRKQRGAWITPQEAMDALDSGQMIKFQQYFSAYGVNQTVHDALKPFKVTNYQFTSTSGGNVTFPDNYEHFLNGAYTVTGSTVNPITFLNPDELPDALTGQLRPVSASNPIAVDTADGFLIFPQASVIGFYSYLKRPDVPVYGYSQVGRVITYDPLTSTQLEWDDSYLNTILASSMQFLGISMDENGIIQFSQMFDKESMA
jgi:hypothetical protein